MIPDEFDKSVIKSKQSLSPTNRINSFRSADEFFRAEIEFLEQSQRKRERAL